MQVITPISQEQIDALKVNDKISITGIIYTGRDAALPKLIKLYENNGLESNNINLQGSVIFHTAVSTAGIGPTSSNKLEIESSIPLLSKAGVKIHLGKGRLGQKTVEALHEYGSIYAVTPPISALLTAKIRKQRIAAFPEEGIEAFHELDVFEFPAIVAIAHGKSIFEKSEV